VNGQEFRPAAAGQYPEQTLDHTEPDASVERIAELESTSAREFPPRERVEPL